MAFGLLKAHYWRMQMITPTVGRKVWYYDDTYHKIGDQPFDASIVFVWNDRMVNLRAYDHDGNRISNTTSIQFLQDDDTPTGSRYCAWMPYQIGQAAKHAAEPQEGNASFTEQDQSQSAESESA